MMNIMSEQRNCQASLVNIGVPSLALVFSLAGLLDSNFRILSRVDHLGLGFRIPSLLNWDFAFRDWKYRDFGIFFLVIHINTCVDLLM